MPKKPKPKPRPRPSYAFVLALAAVLAGCSQPAEVYVRADRSTFDAIAPEYLGYVEADASLAADQKLRRRNLVDTWAKRIREAEGR